ncbi:hypothetical protein [Citromicrobium sp. JLT1363]|uniref:hypothetical protein n=1 Tax=Citromicrobium sp. JLT1363 TaxID=517722 RepID=UPI0002D3786C|nr:hypothetical protein [Citromicrobium sp. JLT1363]
MKARRSLSNRAIRQYRARDVFPYLLLRYFLEGDFARSDDFAMRIAPQIFRSTNHPKYLEIPYFKERDSKGEVQYRSMHMPAPSEVLVEASIIAECSEKADIPDRNVCFSYWPTAPGDETGFFQPYMKGLKARQEAVAEAIRSKPSSTVRYLDIKKFYPSITCMRAEQVWQEFCSGHGISSTSLLAGLHLIKMHERVGDGRMLTGPMFSHLMGNLILKDLDRKCSKRESRIFRYVDDFILVGGAEVDQDIDWLRDELRECGFEAHDDNSDKSLTVEGADWLESARDFESGELSRGWMTLIGDIKKFLLLKPNDGDELIALLRENGFRLPIRAYQTAVNEASTFERVRQLKLWGWFLAKSRGLSAAKILTNAVSLRDKIEGQARELLLGEPPSSDFQRKRMATKLRYRLGRSLYLSGTDFFESNLVLATDWPELEVHFSLMKAMVTGNADHVVVMGANVAQAAAQLFAASDSAAVFESRIESPAQRVGLSIFIANGVPVRVSDAIDSPLLQFATGPVTSGHFDRLTGFLKDAACLHGIGPAKHSGIMRRAFDIAEEVHFDAISLDYGYSF